MSDDLRKRQLRRDAIARRKTVTRQERDAAAAALAEHIVPLLDLVGVQAGTVDGIAAGDVMDLVSGAPCDASAGTTSSRDESAGGRSCVLARSATAMDAAHDDAMTGGTLITFALTPDEAISIINAQELGPIMAVTAQ